MRKGQAHRSRVNGRRRAVNDHVKRRVDLGAKNIVGSHAARVAVGRNICDALVSEAVDEVSFMFLFPYSLNQGQVWRGRKFLPFQEEQNNKAIYRII